MYLVMARSLARFAHLAGPEEVDERGDGLPHQPRDGRAAAAAAAAHGVWTCADVNSQCRSIPGSLTGGGRDVGKRQEAHSTYMGRGRGG